MTNEEGLACVYDDCDYVSRALKDENSMMKLLEFHITAKHLSNSGGGGGKGGGREKVKRPMLALDISEEDSGLITRSVQPSK